MSPVFEEEAVEVDEAPWQPLVGEQTGGLILVIEDEHGIRDFLERGLRDLGFTVESASDGETGTARALGTSFDLVVLDVMLPGRSGLDVLAELRASKPQLPVILLTALGETDDRIAGLDAGAIDYVVKPFSVAELAARIRAQLRSAALSQTTRLSAAEIEIDLLSRKVWSAGAPVHLSATEFQLLAYFLQHTGTVLSRQQILRAVWGYEHDPGTNAVEVYIGYLRRKLRRGDRELPLVTIRSVGYRFDDAA
ncbi:MAG: response regulator transcription factor [Actinomycetota bacterium]|nr:response regulator transcription factor [Actinomycetota bacterium]